MSNMTKKSVFIEIVGFWREEYIEKKLKKLREIVEMHISLILLIDEKIFERFLEITIPKIKYKVSTNSIFLDYKELVREINKMLKSRTKNS